MSDETTVKEPTTAREIVAAFREPRYSIEALQRSYAEGRSDALAEVRAAVVADQGTAEADVRRHEAEPYPPGSEGGWLWTANARHLAGRVVAFRRILDVIDHISEGK